MKRIWKFPAKSDAFVVEMPVGAKILDVQVQDGTPYLWALVDDLAPKERRKLATVGTGHPLPDEIMEGTHIGTFQLHGGTIVLHLFDFGAL